MTTKEQGKDQPTLKLPSHLFLFSLIVGLLIPFIARLPSVPVRGLEWLTDYFPGAVGLLFFSAFNLIPSGAWYAIGKGSKKTPVAFWFSVAGGLAFLLWAHGSVNLSSSSTAAIALLFIPIYAVGAIVAGWVLGLMAHAIVKDERTRTMTAWGVCILAIVFGSVFSFQESSTTVARESRFPFTAVSDIPLQKRHIYERNTIGRIEVLTYGNFDKISGDEIVILSTNSLTYMQPGSYEISTQTKYDQEDCDGCVHMYPYVVPDGKGSLLVSTSNGVSGANGNLRWIWEADGFSRVVPIQNKTEHPKFLGYQNTDYITLHDAEGKVLWSNNIPVSDIGRYNTPEGEQLPFAVTGYKEKRQLNIYSQDGKLYKTIKLPGWASNIEEISWPDHGNLLVGSGSWIGILNQNGDELLKYIIQDTSFRPYHGPEGTAVKFNATEKSYLAVLSHGSSGYARSVLLIFNSEGTLVWQEELKTLSTIIAVPNADKSSEVLLVGGIDGLIEFSLSNETTLNKSLQLTPLIGRN